MASPVCGVPLLPFFVGSAVGTQLSLLFLSLSGAKLREVGEKGFDLRTVQASMVQLGLVMGVLTALITRTTTHVRGRSDRQTELPNRPLFNGADE